MLNLEENIIISILARAKESGLTVYLKDNSPKFRIEKDKSPDPEILELLKENREAIVFLLKNKESDNSKSYDTIPVLNRDSIERIPLSFAQERLWFIDKLQGSLQFHLHEILRLGSDTDQFIIQDTFKDIINRHEVLRTVFKDDGGQPYQEVLGKNQWVLNFTDCSKMGHVEIKSLINTEIFTPFDLEEDHMLRAHLLQIDGGEHLLIWVVHHIATDGWSMPIFKREVLEIYASKTEKRPASLEELPIQYADFATWQRSFLTGGVLRDKLNFWKEKIKGVEPMNLFPDYPRPAVQSSKGATVQASVDANLLGKLKILAQKERVSMFMLLLAAFKVILFRYTGREDIYVTSPIANRGYSEIEPLIGFFLNNLILRSDLGNNPEFSTFLKQVKQTALEAYGHQDVPFEKIVEDNITARDMSRSPFGEIVFVFQNNFAKEELGGLNTGNSNKEDSLIPKVVVAQTDLHFSVVELGSGLIMNLTYCLDLFKPSTIEQLARHYTQLLHSLVEDSNKKIGELSFLAEEEIKQLLVEFNDTKRNYPSDKTIVDLFTLQAIKTPDKIALSLGDEKLTYKELGEKSSILGAYLNKTYAIQPDDLMGIMMERSIWGIVSILGILKSGAAFVPLDKNFPKERKLFILKDTELKALIIESDSLFEVIDFDVNIFTIDIQFEEIEAQGVSDFQIERPALPSDLAYIIYTSGSTGIPKGVMVEHKGIINTALSLIEKYGIVEGDNYLEFASLTFDAALSDIFSALFIGSTIVLVDSKTIEDGDKFLDYLEKHRITAITLPPPFLRILDRRRLRGLRMLNTAGEAPDIEIANECAEFLTYFNSYGPTECSVCVTTFTVESGINGKTGVPVGVPIANTKIYIIDRNNQLLPIGIEGEICVSGAGLARGYLNQKELTAEKFVPNPFLEGELMYRTGDRGKWLPDGNIAFVGRLDNQVKIRGFRVELGEVEKILGSYDLVREAVVLAKPDPNGGKRLVAYVIVNAGYEKFKVLDYLGGQLPDYMVPQIFVKMEKWPLSVSGKIDRKALPDPDKTDLSTTEYVAPKSGVEIQLAKIWEDILGIEKIGIHDNFFELGGHSLLATRVVSSIREKLGREISIVDLFSYPEICSLANQIVEHGKQPDLPPITKQERPDRIPLSFAQERLWFIDRLQGSVHYHIPDVLPLVGNIDKANIEWSFNAIINRHEVLRTIFIEEEGTPYQVVQGKDNWTLEYSDLTDHSEDELKVFMEREMSRPFDLAKDHMLRAHLIKVDNDEHLLVWVLHHIATDGWSMPILKGELLEIYQSKLENREPDLPSLPIQYVDYTLWQRGYLSDSVLDKKISYWEKQLDGAEILNLPLDFKRPPVQSIEGQFTNISIQGETLNQLNHLAKSEGATSFMLLLAVYKILLYKYSGQEDITVGCPIANRTHAEVEPLVGFFLNTLALRSDLGNNPTFTDFLGQIKTTTLEAYSHQDVPFEKLVDKLAQTRDPSITPLFQVLFTYNNNQNDQVSPSDSSQKDVGSEENKGRFVQFDLTIDIDEDESGLSISFGSCKQLFRSSTIERMALHFKSLIHSVIVDKKARIDELQMILEDEENLILGKMPTTDGEWFNQQWVDLGNTEPINVRFERMALLHAQKIAIVSKEKRWTYEKTNEYANQIANTLSSVGVGKTDFVGVYLDRSPEMVACLLGILKIGAVYVPLDTNNTPRRIGKMVSNSEMETAISSMAYIGGIQETSLRKILLIDGSGQGGFTKPSGINILGINEIEKADTDNPVNTNEISSVAYMLYTSGTTGDPKGALLRHDGAMNHILSEYIELGLEDGFNFLQSAGIGSDISVWQILSPLLKGGKTIIVQRHTLLEFDEVVQVIENEQVNIMEFVPSYISSLMDFLDNHEVQPSFTSLRWMMTTGENLPVDLTRKWLRRFPKIPILNGYGPCEASDDVTQYKVTEIPPEDLLRIPIGRPIPNMNILVLGKGGTLCPINVPGEIVVIGIGVGAGYYGMEERTAASFIDNPFDTLLGETMYRTGDMGRWTPDGNLEILGRIDRQLKIRGHRVESGEIESYLVQLPPVKEAHVMVQKKTDSSDCLIAFIVPQGEPSVDFNEVIQSHVRISLTSYMQPTHYCLIEKIPLNLSDKVDEKQLMLLFEEQDPETMNTTRYVAPRNEMEQLLVSIWSNILKVKNIGIKDDFFALGGHSLLVVRVASAIRKQLGYEISIIDLFTYTNIESISTLLSKDGIKSNIPDLIAQERPAKIPVSFSQERLWFIDKLQGSIQYHMPNILPLDGNIDGKILEETFREIIQRHEVLRTVIKEEEGLPYQEILEESNFQLRTANFIDKPIEELKNYILEKIVSPFDLAKDCMINAHLIKVSQTKQLLLWVVHHIASDGWSEDIFKNEVLEIYYAKVEKRPVVLPLLEIQYADFAIWQRTYLSKEVLEEKLKFWEEQLKDVEPLNLPTDYARPAILSTEGKSFYFTLDRELTGNLNHLARQEDITPFMLLLAIFKILLFRYSGQNDICIGTPTANRTQVEIEPLIGFFINTLPIRSKLEGDPSFLTFLQYIKNTTLQAYGHQDVPFEKIVERVARKRNLARNALFQVMFVFQDNQQESVSNNESRTNIEEDENWLEGFEQSQFDITLNVEETDNKFNFQWVYCEDLFSRPTIERMSEHFRLLIFSILNNPKTQVSRLNGLLEKEKAMLVDFNRTNVDFPLENTLVDLFKKQVKATPDKIALVFNETELTYKELDNRSDQLAKYLIQEYHIKPKEMIGIMQDKSEWAIISMLAIMKSQATYVPIDINYPTERKSFIIEDTGIKILIILSTSTQEVESLNVDFITVDMQMELLGNNEIATLASRLDPTSLAYVIYTSGSTGEPKGVMVEHKSAVNITLDHINRFELGSDDKVLQFMALSFDVSINETFMALLSGAALVMMDYSIASDANVFTNYIKEKGVSMTVFPTAFLNLLNPDDFGFLRVILVGGDVANVSVTTQFASSCRVFNAYGPTEATICTTIHEITPADKSKQQIPIGHPIANMQVFILDKNNAQQPLMVEGEICIGGVGLARGYLNQENLTHEKFIPHPFLDGQRLYKTGDLGRWLPNGNLEFLGRKDNQVKINGFRIELGEIETILSMLDGITQSAVIAKENASQGSKVLIAFVECGGVFDKAVIQNFLLKKLPNYMVPSIILQLKKIPMTNNGKVNRKALFELETSELVKNEFVAPRNTKEEEITRIWEEILKVEKIGIHDDFFELGGHSLLASKVVTALKKQFSINIPVILIFQYPTVRSLSEYLDFYQEEVQVNEEDDGDAFEFHEF